MLTSAPLCAAAFLVKNVPLEDVTIKFEIWDTAGQGACCLGASLRFVCSVSVGGSVSASLCSQPGYAATAFISVLIELTACGCGAGYLGFAPLSA